MKWIITLMMFLAIQASASEMRPSEAILNAIRLAHDVNQESLISVDYKMILESDKTMTKERIHELFRTIDPEKVRFGAHDSKTGKIDMIEPKKIRFTMQSRSSSSKVITSVASYHVIVRIELSRACNIVSVKVQSTSKPALRPMERSGIGLSAGRRPLQEPETGLVGARP